jgi:hypothetical protein
MKGNMTELEEFEFEEPNPERIEAIQRACSIFADVCRMSPDAAPLNDEDMSEIINELLTKDRDLTDSVNYTIAWRDIRAKRREAARLEDEHFANIEDRQRQRADYLAPSNRTETAEQLRAGIVSQSAAQFTPAREYSDAEIEEMSSEQYARLVLGRNSVEDRQEHSTRLSFKEARNELILAGKIINRAGVSKPRTVKFSPEELAAQEQRARAIAQGNAERRKLEQDWRKK